MGWEIMGWGIMRYLNVVVVILGDGTVGMDRWIDKVDLVDAA